MSARLCLTNLSGTWTPEQVASSPDLVVCGEMFKAPPVPGAAATLVYVETAAYVSYDGKPYGVLGSYNRMVGEWAQAGGFDKFAIAGGVRLGGPWGGGDPRAAIQLIDITKKGAVVELAKLMAAHFTWADGLQLNGWTSHGWEYPAIPADFWVKWDKALVSMGNYLRALRPDWILCGQQFKLYQSTFAPLGGLYLEQDGTSFGQTWASHSAEKKRFEELMARADPKRPQCWIVELRYQDRYPDWYKVGMLAWAEQDGFVVSWGRGQQAGLGWTP